MLCVTIRLYCFISCFLSYLFNKINICLRIFVCKTHKIVNIIIIFYISTKNIIIFYSKTIFTKKSLNFSIEIIQFYSKNNKYFSAPPISIKSKSTQLHVLSSCSQFPFFLYNKNTHFRMFTQHTYMYIFPEGYYKFQCSHMVSFYSYFYSFRFKIP